MYKCIDCGKTLANIKAKRCRKCYIKYTKKNIPKTVWKKGQNKGNKHPLWKGGMIIYWRKKALERDNYTCRNCELREPEIMEIAHIKPVKNNYIRKYTPQDLDNLITLCPNCHRRFDKRLLEHTAHLKSR